MSVEYSLLFRRIAIASDLVAVAGSFFLAYGLRDWMSVAGVPPLREFDEDWWLLALVLGIWFCCLSAFGFYRPLRYRRYADNLVNLAKAHAVASMLLLAIPFVARRWEISRLLLHLFIVTAFVALAAKQLLVNALLKRQWREGFNSRRALIMGTGDRAARYIQFLREHPYWGVHVIGVADDRPSGPKDEIEGVPIVGGMKDLPEILRSQPTDEVVFAVGPRDFPLVEEDLDLCQEIGVTSRLILDLPQRDWTRQDLVQVDGIGILSLDPVRRPLWALALKRTIDVLGALVGLLVFAAAYLRYARQVRRDSPGPVLFSQVRVGRNRRLFALYKFRTMYVDAEARQAELQAANQMDGAVFKLRDDPRITPLGKRLRALHLDELPQFWNVLRGEMSLVGTRPPTLAEVECYRPHHRRRLSMKPGITGLWQLAGNERVRDFEEIVRLDCRYIDTWSIWLDLQILAKTVVKILRRTGW
jgi:exopolysaccharide biosynthesis polyprenyl glycosylphosphotransferase